MGTQIKPGSPSGAVCGVPMPDRNGIPHCNKYGTNPKCQVALFCSSSIDESDLVSYPTFRSICPQESNDFRRLLQAASRTSFSAAAFVVVHYHHNNYRRTLKTVHIARDWMFPSFQP